MDKINTSPPPLVLTALPPPLPPPVTMEEHTARYKTIPSLEGRSDNLVSDGIGGGKEIESSNNDEDADGRESEHHKGGSGHDGRPPSLVMARHTAAGGTSSSASSSSSSSLARLGFWDAVPSERDEGQGPESFPSSTVSGEGSIMLCIRTAPARREAVLLAD